MSSSMPHLHAVQRRIWRVVPVKSPSMRGAMRAAAPDASPLNSDPSTCWPVRAFGALLTPLFSRYGVARTHAAHCASPGSFPPGGTVPKCAGAAGWGGTGGRVGVGRVDDDGRPEGEDGGPEGDGAAAGTPVGAPEAQLAEVLAHPPSRSTAAASRIDRCVRIGPAGYGS